MKRQTLQPYFLTIEWQQDGIIDWVKAGQIIHLNGQKQQRGRYSYAYVFDAAITSTDGVYAFIYTRLGTKGLLLKNGELLREINRSYLCADAYEYPAAFINYQDKTYLVHCPKEYNRLDFEEVETGEIVTDRAERKLVDFFYSMMSVSPNGKYLIVRGWVWHPVETFLLLNIEDCFKDPLLLDQESFQYDFGMEVNSASFIDNEHILVASSDDEPFDEDSQVGLPPKHIAIWNFKTNVLTKPVRVQDDTGNFFAINNQLAWDMYKYPKLVDIETGKVIDKMEDVSSGLQNSCIYNNIASCPQIKLDKKTGKIAVLDAVGNIDVFSVDDFFGSTP